ncbi:MAG: radical SAM protein [Deltaproteobacteria bacterium]|nr:radical SAM protein [Deltaproteobacteria bacterium]
MTTQPVGFDWIPRVYLTVACNYSCFYCTNALPPRKLISAERWIEVLNRLPGDELIFTGGEPTLHPGFTDIVNGVKQAKIRMYTNMSWDVGMLDRLQKRIKVFASCHPGQKKSDTVEAISDKAVELLRRGHRILDIHSIAANGDLSEAVEIFARKGLKLRIEPDMWEVMETMIPDPSVHCRINRFFLGPDGLRYLCIKKLEVGDPTGVVNHSRLEAERSCHIHGECRPCDVRIYRVRPLFRSSENITAAAG